MLLVYAGCGSSSIHGIGLFAQEFIAAGTPTWIFQPGFDLILTEAAVLNLSPNAQKQVKYYAFFNPQKQVYILSSDDDRFTNHSDDPNTRLADDRFVAVRNIYPGEEITCDYQELGWTEFLGNASNPASKALFSSICQS